MKQMVQTIEKAKKATGTSNEVSMSKTLTVALDDFINTFEVVGIQ